MITREHGVITREHRWSYRMEPERGEVEQLAGQKRHAQLRRGRTCFEPVRLPRRLPLLPLLSLLLRLRLLPLRLRVRVRVRLAVA